MLTPEGSIRENHLCANELAGCADPGVWYAVVYFRPEKLTDALDWLSAHASGNARIAAGCTDLFPSTTASRLLGDTLDVTAIEEIRTIRQSDGVWRFGGAVTWTDIIKADLPPAFDCLKLAAREVGSIQIQNAGTLAGNLCNASPAADGSPCWLTLDATVVLASKNGIRELPLADFMVGPRRTAIAADEILTEIRVGNAAARGQSTFLKLGARKYLIISIAMVAARLTIERNRVSQAAIAVGSCSGVPVRLTEVEDELVGRSADPTLTEHVAEADVAVRLSPIADMRADHEYRLAAADELVRRSLLTLVDGRERRTA